MVDAATFDYVIVGAGSAGCVLANRLTADGKTSACVVEAGSSDRAPMTRFKTRVPVGNTFLLSSRSFNWSYVYAGAEGLHHSAIPAHRGRVEGGSSAVNGMVYMRGVPGDYDGWAAQGNRGWGYDDVLPIFKRQENREAGANEFHGVGGELNVAKLRWLNPLTSAFVAAAQQTQFPLNDDFNGARQDGFGPHEVTQKNGQRWSAARAFLHPALGRPNLALVCDALTMRVDVRDGRATGVTVRVDGAERSLAARRSVIVAAGTFNSPQILLLSGIGPGDVLQQHGIPVVRELPGVGRNLHDHPSGWIHVHDRSARSFALSARALPWMAAAVANYALFRRGPLTSNMVEAGGFARTDAQVTSPDIQFVFMPAMKDWSRWVSKVHAFGLSATLLRPKSRGYLTLASRDPAAPPVLHPRFLEHDDDVRRLVAGLRIARQILSAPAFAEARGEEIRPGAQVTSTEGLVDYLRKNLSTSYHPVGTCKMGPEDDPMAVVDDRLRVRGVAGLSVIDASIMPAVTSGNTNAPTMMIAERGAEFLRADAR